MHTTEGVSPASSTPLPESLKYLNAEQIAEVKEFWTLQAELGLRQRWNVVATLLVACSPLVDSMFSPELGNNAGLVKNIMFSVAILGTLLGGICVILNRATSAKLERMVLSMNMRIGSMEKIIGVGRAVKQIKFVPFGHWIFQRIGQGKLRE